MYRYNICHRLTTGELVYLGKQQQWVSDVTQTTTVFSAVPKASRQACGPNVRVARRA